MYRRSMGAYWWVSRAYSWPNPLKYLKKISWTYWGHIRAYRDVSRRIKVVKILLYASWSIGCVSHANRTRTNIEYVSDTGYVGKMLNLSNPDWNVIGLVSGSVVKKIWSGSKPDLKIHSRDCFAPIWGP
jgi:hypothetical protein